MAVGVAMLLIVAADGIDVAIMGFLALRSFKNGEFHEQALDW